MKPSCPYCDDSSGKCAHVILDYDATFGDYRGGYLAGENDTLEVLKASILALILAGKNPQLEEGFLQDIWEYACSSYHGNPDYYDFDDTAYFNLLLESIEVFGGEAVGYGDDDDDGPPGYSSAEVIFFAEDPKETIASFNTYILQELAR